MTEMVSSVARHTQTRQGNMQVFLQLNGRTVFNIVKFQYHASSHHLNEQAVVFQSVEFDLVKNVLELYMQQTKLEERYIVF